MIGKYFILLLVIVGNLHVNAEVQVQVFPGETDENTIVNYFGESLLVINNAARNLFRLSNAALWNGIQNFHEGNPDDVFLRDPTGHLGNLYHQYNWRQTTVILKPVGARSLNLTTVPVAVLTQIFTNDHPTLDATFNVQLSQNIENRVMSGWSQNTEEGLNVKIGYNIGIVSASTSFNYKNSWGEKYEDTESVTIGTTSGMQVVLRPGESVLAELVASRGNLRVDVDYEASLTGRVVANYYYKHKEHHFWAYDVNSILDGAGLPRSVLTTETINVGFFSAGHVRLTDSRTRKLIGVYPVNIEPVKTVT